MISLANYYSEYIGYLKENREKIRDALVIPENSSRAELYAGLMDGNFFHLPGPVKPEAVVSATDGSEFIRELYNGMKIILTRAISITGKEEFLSSDISVKSVSRYSLQAYVTRCMEIQEHMSLEKCISERDVGIALLDGSAAGRLTANIEKIDGDDMENFSVKYKDAAMKLLRTAKERGTRLVFVSKSSDSKAYKKQLLDGSKTLDQDGIRREYLNSITDHTIIKSIARFPGYSDPVITEKDMGALTVRMVTTHILPAMNDTPMKVDIIFMEGETDMDTITDRIIRMIVWGYSGLKIHNVWLSDVDRKVKFTREETEEVLMKAFERETGVIMPETRGERRARIRI